MSETVKKNDLKKCPFCGGKAIMESWDMLPYEKANIDTSDGKWYSVYCDKCLSYGGDYTTAQDAVEAWNRRTESM